MAKKRTGLALDPATNDLFLDDSNNLALVHDAEAVGQHVRQRLQSYEGEWFLDTTAGVPWLGRILGQNYDPALAEAVVKTEILETDMVTEITSFSVGFDAKTRGVRIHSVSVNTEYDQEVEV